jgi:hypothetical protein
MKLRNLILTGAALLMASPLFAATYFGGYEDVTGRGSDYDYNDIVFSLSGANLKLVTLDGAWYKNPVVNENGNPFWDNASFDGPKMNVGYCIYGGGNCGTALAPDALYLASKNDPTKSSNLVYFSNSGTVETDVFLKVAAKNNVLGYYDLSNNKSVIINPNGSLGDFQFTTKGNFILFGATYLGNGKYTDYNYSYDPGCDGKSQFAFFAPVTSPVPEPGTMGIIGAGLVGLAAIARRRRKA